MTTSPLANPTATRELLEEFGLATKHRLGQNFLIDNHVIERICELAELAGDERVLEVGPGVGTLTLALLQEAACVTSIEADPELEPVLDAHAADYANFRFIMGDALKVTPEQIEQVAGGKPTAFVANLPYNVAATIILQFFQTMPALKRAVVMVQKEVADRIAATPGKKTYGGYTAKLGLYAQVTGRFEVPPRCFMPAPHVDSAVVRIDRVDGVVPEGIDREFVARVIDAAFAQRRKTIRNTMSANGFAKDVLDAAFEACGIAPTMRAETLERAKEAGIDLLVTVFDPIADKRSVTDYSDWLTHEILPMQDIPQIKYLAGVHPYGAPDYTDDIHAQVVAALDDPLCVGIGEIGLDYHMDYDDDIAPAPHDVQIDCMARQLELAARRNVAVELHLRHEDTDGERTSHVDAYNVLREVGVPQAGCVLHCFGEDRATMERFVDLGCYIAYGGAATFKRNDDVREAFAATPLDRILFETDCPYMAPEPIRGLECEPAMISITANALVNDRVDRTGEDPEAIARAAWENACKLFQK